MRSAIITRPTSFLVSIVLAFVLGISGTLALAQQNIGAYASGPAPNGKDAVIPPGHYGIIADRADEVLASGLPPTKYAEDVNEALADPESFFVVDIRQPGAYCQGHIPGAVNIPFRMVAMPENLAILPTDRPILVVCYTGHTASQTTMLYNLLGYEAYALRFAMMSWVDETNMKIWTSEPSESQDIYGGNYLTTELCTP